MNIRQYFEQDKKLFVKVIAGIVLLAVTFVFYLIKHSGEEELTLSDLPQDPLQASQFVEEPVATEDAINDVLMIIVDVAGAVKNPSVVELQEGSRVFEAIEAAGGLTKDADTRYTNQAEILTDGQKLYIPTSQELEEHSSKTVASGYSIASGFNNPNSSASGLININTADSEMLQQLSGVGPATAEKIIQYRTENGKFKSIDEITNVSGIGEKTLNKFKDKITIK